MEVIPDTEEDGEQHFGAKIDIEKTIASQPKAKSSHATADEAKTVDEDSEPPRPKHWPKNKKLKHRIQCHDGKPWRVPRWVDLGKIQFRLTERNGKRAPLCNLPSLGLLEFPAREDHLGRLESISDPLTDEFKQHIRFKLESATRVETVPRETSYGGSGTAGAPKPAKEKF